MATPSQSDEESVSLHAAGTVTGDTNSYGVEPGLGVHTVLFCEPDHGEQPASHVVLHLKSTTILGHRCQSE